MGIHVEVIKGEGISFIVDEEVDTLLRIAKYFINTDELKADLEKHYTGEQEQKEMIEEILDVYLPTSIKIKNFGNQVIDSRSAPNGIMLTGDLEHIQIMINDLGLTKRISHMAKAYIG